MSAREREKLKHHLKIFLLKELAPQLPPIRKLWMSEDHRMAIFDAAALALSYLKCSEQGMNAQVERS